MNFGRKVSVSSLMLLVLCINAILWIKHALLRLENDEGLQFRCTAKGKKEGCKQARFMVAISYDCGVVLCRPLSGKLNAQKMSKMIKNYFPLAFHLSINPKSKRLLQDGCPVQKFQKSKEGT